MNNTGKRFKRVRVRRTTSPGIILGDGVINSAPPRRALRYTAGRWKAVDSSWGYIATCTRCSFPCGRLNASCYVVMLRYNNASFIYWFIRKRHDHGIGPAKKRRGELVFCLSVAFLSFPPFFLPRECESFVISAVLNFSSSYRDRVINLNCMSNNVYVQLSLSWIFITT